MESVVDITTTAFQAVFGVLVVFTAGYAYNGKNGPALSTTLLGVAKTVLLPCLVFITLAGSSYLSWRRLLMIFWPSLIIALLAHVASLAFGFLAWRFTSSPEWIVEACTFNNVSSYPLLLLYTMYMLSDGEHGPLSHLRWRILDTPAGVLERAVLYLVVNLLITHSARFFIRRILPKPRASTILLTDDLSDAASSPGVIHGAAGDEEEDERTPLIPPRSASIPIIRSWRTYIHPLSVAAVLGLFVGLIKPIQRRVLGVSVDHTFSQTTGTWQALGSGLMILGAGFALVEMLGIGAGLRAGEKKVSPEDKVPPVLGTVLVVLFWRYVVVPLIVVSTVHGFRQINSTKTYIQDPAFSFILALTSLTPPSLPPTLTPYRSAAHLPLFPTLLFTSLPLALAIAVSASWRSIGSSASDFDLVAALKSAAGGGIAGAAAMVVQVLALMPMRTIMNYQYRYGGGLKGSTRSLWQEGGFKRYYAGLGAALFQAPLSRFGDTAANAFIVALLASLTWPVLIKTVAASLGSAAFRMLLTPIDTLKTTQQTRGGKEGLKLLRERIKVNGVGCLWWGALATAAATFVGHYPWFGTYNWLSATLPPPNTFLQKLARQAFIGFAASVVSDTISNSLRVVKTYRQVHERDVGYFEAAREIIQADGLLALFGRGLPTRLITNGLQGLIFSILWKLFADIIAGNGKGA